MYAVETKEIRMRVYSLEELFRLTRTELFALHHRIAAARMQLPESGPERLVALANLRNIRQTLAQPNLTPT
jgi:hypothetical protein